MIKSFYADATPLKDPAVMQKYYEALSEERRQKADRCGASSHKLLSVAAGFLLEEKLSTLFGIPKDRIQYRTVQNGKPVLTGEADGISFNLSHSKSCVLCTLADTRPADRRKTSHIRDRELLLGCDIEKIRPVDLRLAGRFFYKSEHEYIMSRPNEEEAQKAFFRLWTLKESYMKAVGLGFALPLNEFEISFDENDRARVSQNGGMKDFRFDEYEREGFRIAVCCPETVARDGDPGTLEKYEWHEI